jgi:hypothetical protein
MCVRMIMDVYVGTRVCACLRMNMFFAASTMTAIIRASIEAGPHVRVKRGCAAAAVQHRTPAFPCPSGRVEPVLSPREKVDRLGQCIAVLP